MFYPILLLIGGGLVCEKKEGHAPQHDAGSKIGPAGCGGWMGDEVLNEVFL